MRYIIILLFLLSKVDPLWSQARESYDKGLLKLVTANIRLEETLVRSVEYLKRCKNYDSTIVFKLVTVKGEGGTFLSISCSRSKDILLNDKRNPYGYFVFHEHLFIVCGDTSTTWFSHGSDKELFSINREPAIYMVEEPPEWLYEFTGDRFSLRKMINECIDERHKLVKFR